MSLCGLENAMTRSMIWQAQDVFVGVRHQSSLLVSSRRLRAPDVPTETRSFLPPSRPLVLYFCDHVTVQCAPLPLSQLSPLYIRFVHPHTLCTYVRNIKDRACATTSNV